MLTCVELKLGNSWGESKNDTWPKIWFEKVEGYSPNDFYTGLKRLVPLKSNLRNSQNCDKICIYYCLWLLVFYRIGYIISYKRFCYFQICKCEKFR